MWVRHLSQKAGQAGGGVPFPYFHISPLRARKAWDPQGLQRVGNGCGGHLVEGSWDRPWDIASSSTATRGSRRAWDGGSHLNQGRITQPSLHARGARVPALLASLTDRAPGRPGRG